MRNYKAFASIVIAPFLLSQSIHIEIIPMKTRLSAIAFISNIAQRRQWVFDDIDRWLKESKERFFILTGEPGVVKSAIAGLSFNIFIIES